MGAGPVMKTKTARVAELSIALSNAGVFIGSDERIYRISDASLVGTGRRVFNYLMEGGDINRVIGFYCRLSNWRDRRERERA